MDITRNPEGFQVPGVVEMNPTSLPELSKPLRDLNFDQKREKLKFQNFEKFQKKYKRLFAVQRTPIYFLFSHFGHPSMNRNTQQVPKNFKITRAQLGHEHRNFGILKVLLTPYSPNSLFRAMLNSIVEYLKREIELVRS